MSVCTCVLKCIRVFVCVYVRVCICSCVFVYACMLVCVLVCLCVSVRVRVCVWMCVYFRVCLFEIHGPIYKILLLLNVLYPYNYHELSVMYYLRLYNVSLNSNEQDHYHNMNSDRYFGTMSRLVLCFIINTLV